MGTIFGKQTVAEPVYQVLYTNTNTLAYEIRRYGERFAAQAHYLDGTDDGTPFRLLARYIGVFGTPENEGKESISMTAPVVKQRGTEIAMTAPVVKSRDGTVETMRFILPAEYDSFDKIPRPTNPKVEIVTVPPAVGAVHRYSGSFDDNVAYEHAMKLADQLKRDGVNITTDYVAENYQFWGYNPPFTMPMFRRNEIWVELSEEQVNHLVNGYVTSQTN